MILPKASTSAKLFATGATVGPFVDAIHNQCLLRYGVLPIDVVFNDSLSIRTSWLIPPLLGVAYVVLGGVLPRIFSEKMRQPLVPPSEHAQDFLQIRALLAVMTTALIIKLSEYLETTMVQTHAIGNLNPNAIMWCAALVQWAILDSTPAALFAAVLAAFGGPLSELPFIAHGFWTYLPDASDYFPLSPFNLESSGGGGWQTLLFGDDPTSLALSSITGPCYFAVTMDSIALGRWFDALGDKTSNQKGDAVKEKETD